MRDVVGDPVEADRVVVRLGEQTAHEVDLLSRLHAVPATSCLQRARLVIAHPGEGQNQRIHVPLKMAEPGLDQLAESWCLRTSVGPNSTS